MKREITQSEKWGNTELTYKIDVVDGGVSEIQVVGTRKGEGSLSQVDRRYWRDNTFRPTQSESYLSDEENAHIVEEVSKIWEQYPNIEPLELDSEEE